jgi:uncharacterized protein (DUF362 family)
MAGMFSMQNKRVGEVFVLKTADRSEGVKTLFKQFGQDEFGGAKVVLKANYNSADPFPASTHPDTLRAVVEFLKGAGAESVTLAERSGMGVTRRVLEEMGVFELGEKLGFDVVVNDELGKAEWVRVGRSRRRFG